MIGTLRAIYKGEGVRGLFRGNLVNLMKSSPESAVKFAVFERAQLLFDKDQLSPGETFLCGAAGGVVRKKWRNKKIRKEKKRNGWMTLCI